jgi:hypothetical protein
MVGTHQQSFEFALYFAATWPIGESSEFPWKELEKKDFGQFFSKTALCLDNHKAKQKTDASNRSKLPRPPFWDQVPKRLLVPKGETIPKTIWHTCHKNLA